jgi:hypothetical protein
MAAANVNMRFTKTNDLLSSNFVSADPALGFEFGYTNLVFVCVREWAISKHRTTGQHRKVGFQPNIGWALNTRHPDRLCLN